MNPHTASASAQIGAEPSGRHIATGDWKVVRILIPYLWEFRGRVVMALAFLIIAKLANISVPLVMKEIVDGLDATKQALAVPVLLLVAYGVLRMSSTLFAELRDIVFVKVTQRAMRRIALTVFRHLHALSLRFHLDRQTGGVSRDIERGTRGIATLMSFMLFSILPTVLEIGLVSGLLFYKFDHWFAIITVGALVFYIGTTFTITEWRTEHRRQMNDMDSKANTKAIDSLLNYETVKYFANEEYEARRYDHNLQRYESAAVKSETSLGLLNSAQSAIIGLTVALLMWRV